MSRYDRLLLIAAVGLAITGSTANAQTCSTFREARVLYPNKHLYRNGQCWSAERRRNREYRRERREPRPQPAPEVPKTIVVIQPWLPVLRPLFIPWEERVEPNIHQGAKP